MQEKRVKMNSSDAKSELIAFLDSHLETFRKVHNSEYQTRCPFCGDSSDPNHKGHLYMRIDITNENASPYICFKCQKKGIIGKELMNAFHFDDLPPDILGGLRESKRVVDDKGYFIYDYKIPDKFRYPNKIKYLIDRYKYEFTSEDLRKLKVVTSIYDFLALNKINAHMMTESVMVQLEKDYIGFLTTGNTHLILRDVSNSHKFLWIDYPITEYSRNSKKFYTIIDDLNLECINDTDVYICEGITDSIGIELFAKEQENQTVICGSLGKDFKKPIDRLIQLGVF